MTGVARCALNRERITLAPPSPSQRLEVVQLLSAEDDLS
jgi:hypothetical protein